MVLCYTSRHTHISNMNTIGLHFLEFSKVNLSNCSTFNFNKTASWRRMEFLTQIWSNGKYFSLDQKNLVIGAITADGSIFSKSKSFYFRPFLESCKITSDSLSYLLRHANLDFQNYKMPWFRKVSQKVEIPFWGVFKSCLIFSLWLQQRHVLHSAIYLHRTSEQSWWGYPDGNKRLDIIGLLKQDHNKCDPLQ
jgi:hypothetical protein